MNSSPADLIAIYPAFETGKISWDQFGGCTQVDLEDLKRKWFPDDVDSRILVQDIWNHHPKRLAQELAAGAAGQLLPTIKDVLKTFDRETARSIVLVGPEEQYLLAGSGENPAGGNVGPLWLKARLPTRSGKVSDTGAASVGVSEVHKWSLDLSLPLPNVFFDSMYKHALGHKSVKAFLDYYNGELKKNHTLVLGSSGCGKTALCLTLAHQNFLVYLEIPAADSGSTHIGRGHLGRFCDWRAFAAEEDVHQALYADVTARLVVLKQVLEAHPDLSSLAWLLYCVSAEGGKHIARARDVIGRRYPKGLGMVYANTLQDEINELPNQKLRYQGQFPLILLVDELQAVAGRWRASPAELSDGRRNGMDAVVFAATQLCFPAVWSGTRVGVTAGKADISGIAKQYLGQVRLMVACGFEYLSPDAIEHMLKATLVLDSVAPATVKRMSYLLQGRARMLALFVDLLLNREHSGGVWPAALGDEFLLGTLQCLMEDFVVQRYTDELSRMRQDQIQDHHLSPSGIGEIWAFNMLPATKHLSTSIMDRRNSLTFTERGDVVQGPPQKYLFHYRFGEPGLQEALMRYVRSPEAVADEIALKGIDIYMRNQATASGLGGCCDLCLALSFLYRCDTLLRTVLENNTGRLGMFRDYELTIKRIVSVDTAQQLEWFRRVNDDVMDLDFSVAPGIPVRDILILPNVSSGADLLCVATRPSSDPETSTSGDPASAGAESVPVGTTRQGAFSYASPVKKQRSGTAKASTSSSAVSGRRPERVFVQLCSALYTDLVPNKKCQDQKMKARRQFEHITQPSAAATEYMDLARRLENDGVIDYLPILAELPRSNHVLSASEAGQYVRMTAAEVVRWGLFTADGMSELAQRKGVRDVPQADMAAIEVADQDMAGAPAQPGYQATL